jgi:hypothetical protein
MCDFCYSVAYVSAARLCVVQIIFKDCFCNLPLLDKIKIFSNNFIIKFGLLQLTIRFLRLLPVADDGEHFSGIRGRSEALEEMAALCCPAGKGEHLNLLIGLLRR